MALVDQPRADCLASELGTPNCVLRPRSAAKIVDHGITVLDEQDGPTILVRHSLPGGRVERRPRGQRGDGGPVEVVLGGRGRGSACVRVVGA